MIGDSFNAEAIPEELRARDQWVTWRRESRRDGKPTKVPWRADTAARASSTNPATWSSFDLALDTARRRDDAGIGFMLTESDPYVGIDLDHVIDENGSLSDVAEDIIARINSYAEVSPSGLGVRMFAKGRLPAGERKRDGIELYENKRFLTVTGNRIPDAAETIEERTAEIADVHATYLAKPAKASAPRKPASRHDKLVSNAVQLRKSGAEVPDIRAALAARNDSFPERKPSDEVDRIAEWATLRVESDLPEIIELRQLVDYGNDTQNAKYFARRNRGRLLFNGSERAWFAYDGLRWARDDTRGVVRLAKAAVYDMMRCALTVESDEYKRKAVQYAVNSGNRRHLDAMIELAKSELPATAEQFDRDPFILNLLNGTLDLKTGALRPHDPQDRLTKLAPVAYDENARASRWEEFLEEIFRGHRDLIEYVQRLVGYALTGDTSEHVLPIAWGSGANGKSVLVNVIENLLGDYALHADVSLFLARREHGATPELARLKGVRFVAASEMPEGGRLSENLVKSLTGGDRIAARHLYGEIIEFTPSAKFFLATNYKPIVRGDDDGIWRRLKLLPFEASFLGSRCDRRLSEKLKSELPGILRWAVLGCLRWQAEGLSDPKPVVAAMAEYRSDSDAIGAFLAERCVLGNGVKVRATPLAAEYKDWCEASNERPLAARAFRAKIRERGFDGKPSNGDFVFFGVGLRDNRESSVA